MPDQVTYQHPGEVADRLGVSPSGLRRLAAIYAEIHGELPRDSANNRLWPSDAVERLEAARALVQADKAKSIREALLAVERGLEAPTEVALQAPPEGAPGVALGVLIEEIRTLRYEVAQLRQELRALEPGTGTRTNLEGSPKGEPKRRWLAWLIERLQRWA